MNILTINALKVLRKIYAKVFNIKPLQYSACEQDVHVVSKLIYDTLMNDRPCMVARFGSTELMTMVNYLGIIQSDSSLIKYIKGESLAWWWNENIISQLQRWSGFFPATRENVVLFCELMLQDIKEVDILGSWIPEERYFQDNIAGADKVSLLLLEPYLSPNPWSRCLKGKKILVVHPFASLIETQYARREELFKNRDVLPEFELQTIKAVQSLGGDDNGFNDWFEALEWMKNEINKRDYDICLIGCGAYGFPLAAHVKRMGKKSVHLGGALQLLFGIKGKRWEASNYATNWGLPQDTYLSMFNDYWTKPTSTLTPVTANEVEGACYW